MHAQASDLAKGWTFDQVAMTRFLKSWRPGTDQLWIHTRYRVSGTVEWESPALVVRVVGKRVLIKTITDQGDPCEMRVKPDNLRVADPAVDYDARFIRAEANKQFYAALRKYRI